MLKVQKGHVVKVHYTGKLTSGEVFDTSSGREPLQFTVGAGQMIAGFDAGVEGMQVGESKIIEIPFGQAYGESRQDLIAEFPKEQLPEGFPLEIGAKIGVNLSNGRQIPAIVTEIKEAMVVIDANPPLAGKDLVFEVQMVEIQDAEQANKSPLFFD